MFGAVTICSFEPDSFLLASPFLLQGLCSAPIFLQIHIRIAFCRHFQARAGSMCAVKLPLPPLLINSFGQRVQFSFGCVLCLCPCLYPSSSSRSYGIYIVCSSMWRKKLRCCCPFLTLFVLGGISSVPYLSSNCGTVPS